MDTTELSEICFNFDLEAKRYQCETYGSGLVNTTYLLKDLRGLKNYILQKVNTTVFKSPDDIAFNQTLAYNHLKLKEPDYFFLSFFITINDKDVYYDKKGGAWRLFPFIKHSVSYDFLGTTGQAFSAAQQFGKLTRLLDGIDVNAFKIIIPDFHNLSYRYHQFNQALLRSKPERQKKAIDTIQFYIQHDFLVREYEKLIQDNTVPIRIMHNDTKISNILFDTRTHEAICVIDLDTLMPGLFLYDIGDMIRTFTCPVNEDEPDASKIFVREEIFESIIKGYLSEMKQLLTPVELSLIYYSGQMMIYMIGLRFLTDYLNNDVYYKTLRPEHNLDRANNQRFLLTDYESKRPLLEEIINRYVTS